MSAQVKAFFLLLHHRKIAKAKKQAFFKLNNCRKNSRLLRGVTELYSFESEQILVSLISLNFFLFGFGSFSCGGWHCF